VVTTRWLALVLLPAVLAAATAHAGCDGAEAQIGSDIRCLKPKDTFRDCVECPEMVMVPAGSFTMGSPMSEEARLDNEEPRRMVIFARPLAVGRFEVTFAEWDACVIAGDCLHRPDDAGWGRGRRPAINVSWNDITDEYLPWLLRKTGKTYRLLTEAEWEYAARAGTTKPFSTGRTITPEQANFDGAFIYGGSARGMSRNKTLEVGLFAPNAFGLHDMHGNVREWVEDCYMDNYAGAPLDGSAATSRDCAYRVLRGGSWNSEPMFLRSANRIRSRPDDRTLGNDGFRVRRSLGP
jgi:formylglycine-generating enzyme required for sulfatase activity